MSVEIIYVYIYIYKNILKFKIGNYYIIDQSYSSFYQNQPKKVLLSSNNTSVLVAREKVCKGFFVLSTKNWILHLFFSIVGGNHFCVEFVSRFFSFLLFYLFQTREESLFHPLSLPLLYFSFIFLWKQTQ